MKLGLELSQHDASIAVQHGGQYALRMVSVGGRQERYELWPMIDTAVREIGGAPSDLTDVVVNAGPGGFTGIRTAVAIAAMLGRLGARVLSLPAHLAVAEASLDTDRSDASIILAVKRNRGWVGTVTWQDGLWASKTPPQDTNLDTFFLDHQPTRVVADEHLPEILRTKCKVIPLRTSALALIDRLEVDQTRTPLDMLRPIYPRVPEAVRLWEERKPNQ